jgi:phosphoglycolate phosphatase
MFCITNFKAVIVDLDGTMVDTLGDFEVALNRMLAQFALPAVNRAFIERTVGKGSEHLIAQTLEFIKNTANVSVNGSYSATDTVVNTIPKKSTNMLTLEQAYDAYQSHYLAINGQHSAVYAGVREGLDALRARGLKLACLTNKPIAFALPLLKAKGLGGYFSHVFGGDAFARKKPDPLPLLETCKALGTLPAQTLMLGDSSNDALAARAAGCPVILVTYGYNHGEPIGAVDADGFVDSLADLAFSA